MIVWMLAKLLSVLTSAKGAAAAVVIAGAATSSGVVATNEDVRTAISGAIETIASQPTSSQLRGPAGASARPSPSGSGQPAVVAARNTADKDLRDAFQDDQQRLEKLRGTRVDGADRQKLNDIITAADAKLRDRLTKALNDVAALTLGREGQGSASPAARPSFAQAAQPQVDAIVRTAIADMAAIVTAAENAVSALPTIAPGRPSDAPGGRPSDAPGGRPSASPGERPVNAPGAKPSDVPGAKPSDLPGGKPTDVPGAKPADVPAGPPSTPPRVPPAPPAPPAGRP
jgi:hypothetical protein